MSKRLHPRLKLIIRRTSDRSLKDINIIAKVLTGDEQGLTELSQLFNLRVSKEMRIATGTVSPEDLEKLQNHRCIIYIEGGERMGL